MVYSFDEQLRLGKVAEWRIDRLLVSLGYQSRTVGMDSERLGIDRIITTPSGDTLTAEYKADFWGGRTGNVFLESDVDGKPGWVLRTRADAILYWMHPGKTVVDSYVYVLNRVKLLKWFHRYKRELQKKIVPNEGFIAEGYLAPIHAVYPYAGIKRLTMKKEFLR